MSLLQRLACVMRICLDAINLHSLVQASSVFSNVCMHHDPGQLVRTAGVISTSSLLHTDSLLRWTASSAASSSSSPTADAEHGPVMRAIRDARDDISWFSAFTLGMRQDLGFNAAVTTSEESFASSSVHEQLASSLEPVLLGCRGTKLLCTFVIAYRGQRGSRDCLSDPEMAESAYTWERDCRVPLLSHIGDNEALGIACLTLRWLNLHILGNEIAVYLCYRI